MTTSQQLTPELGVGQLFAQWLSETHFATHCFAGGGAASGRLSELVGGGSFAVGWSSG